MSSDASPPGPGQSDPTSPPSPLGVAILAWLIPGAGYFRLGRPWPGIFVACAVVPLLVFGMYLAGWENVSYQRHPWYFILQSFAGIPTFAASLLTENVVPLEKHPFDNVGQLYTAVAGMLNLMAVADCWARCHRGDPEGPEPAATGTADGSGGAVG